MTSPASLTRPRPPSNPPTTTYLLLYNLTSSILWLTILGRLLLLLLLAPSPAHTHTYAALGTFTRNVQTLALLEILHSALGAVRSPLSTTAMQVASRVVLVWVVVEGFRGIPIPDSSDHAAAAAAAPPLEQSPAYSSMLFAWSLTEVIRYTFFVCQLHADVAVPRPLAWARYNLFWVMYPLGIGSECWLVWRASCVAGQMSGGVASGRPGEAGQKVAGVDAGWWQYGFWVVLAVYVPGSWVMMMHMVKQRRRVARGKGKER